MNAPRRFTDRAHVVKRLAVEEAKRLGTDRVGTEHLLIGLSAEGAGLAARVLEKYGADPPKVRAAVERIVVSGEKKPAPRLLPVTQRAQQAVERASGEASALGADVVATGHLLLGVLGDRGCAGAKALEALGIVRDELRERLLFALGVIRVRTVSESGRYVPCTTHAWKVLFRAVDEADAMGNELVAPEHILLGIVRDGVGRAADLLRRHDVEPDRLREVIEGASRPVPDPVLKGWRPFGPLANHVLEKAVEKMDHFGHRSASIEYLLFGLLCLDGVGAYALDRLGVSIARLRKDAVRMLGASAETEHRLMHARWIESHRIGLEVCIETPPEVLRSARFGLLMNQASVDQKFRYAHRLLAKRFPDRLTALFSPQHGFFTEQQDNMIESPHGRDRRLGIPIHSLYGETRKPKPEMLEGLDCLVIDLQDVGTRVYTYVWTALHCLEACAEAGIPVVALDRPNPLGGTLVEGPLLEPQYRSFVGLASIPMRHGLTMGELLRYLNDSLAVDCELVVVPMRGYRQSMILADTRLAWVAPSPNLPRPEGALVYPGQVLLEGTNLSEGRGTTTPFEIFGAPFLDPPRLLDELRSVDLPGVTFRPLRFEPTFHKWHGLSCGGLFLHVTDREAFRPYRTSIALLDAVRRLWPDQFEWTPPPYEYETEKMPIDILSGSTRLRKGIDSYGPLDDADLDAISRVDEEDWWARVESSRLYPM